MKIQNNSARPKIRLAIFKFLVRLFFGETYHVCKRHKRKEKEILLESLFKDDRLNIEELLNPKVLLREAETCPMCGKVYLSLYPLRLCGDHEGLEIKEVVL